MDEWRGALPRTWADSDGLQELLPPAAGANDQRQVGLLQDFVYSTLQQTESYH